MAANLRIELTKPLDTTQLYVHAAGTTYTIIDGVRRARAAALAGHSAIRAIVLAADGTQLGECDLPLNTLRSKRDAIPRITSADEARWQRALGGSRVAPMPFPPILVQPGKTGLRVEDIGFDFGDVS